MGSAVEHCLPVSLRHMSMSVSANRQLDHSFFSGILFEGSSPSGKLSTPLCRYILGHGGLLACMHGRFWQTFSTHALLALAQSTYDGVPLHCEQAKSFRVGKLLVCISWNTAARVASTGEKEPKSRNQEQQQPCTEREQQREPWTIEVTEQAQKASSDQDERSEQTTRY